MAVRTAVGREESLPEASQRSKVIVIGETATLPQFAAGLKPPESYRVKVEPERIILCGTCRKTTSSAKSDRLRISSSRPKPPRPRV
jgi:hypothetical protein